MINSIQLFLRRLGGTKSYSQDGIRMVRVDRDAYKYSENDHNLIVQVELQSGSPDYLIYADSISNWLPPYQHEPITQIDRKRITEKIGRFIEYYGETFKVK